MELIPYFSTIVRLQELILVDDNANQTVLVVELDEPEEPRLNILNVNMVGVLYTVKLALFYFRKQHASNNGDLLDQNLILQGSLVGYLDLPGAIQYTSSKWGLRGIMRTLRRSELQHNIRVNYIGPWYVTAWIGLGYVANTLLSRFVQTKIMSETVVQHLHQRNVEFATVEDAGEAALRIISDPKVIGRSFAILPRSLAPRGYQDIDYDDYPDDILLKKLQDAAEAGNYRATVREWNLRADWLLIFSL